jgi:UDP-2,3-diacylglucosamine pyrophosphatase LpxH
MKINYYLLSIAFVASCIISCNDEDVPISTNPFDSISVSSNDNRDKIVVISDLHLGNDLSYSENVAHLGRLEQFLNEVRSSSTVKELVIGGDMFDEWYIPSRTNTYGTGTQADFIRKTVTTNQKIFSVLNGIISDGKVKLTYIPGNHDMGISSDNVDLALPGVNQARDSQDKFGIGTYHPEGYPQIAIEHGHRYDFFCALAPGASSTETPNTTFGPGYFFARIAANSFTDPTTEANATKTPTVVLNDSTNAEQASKNLYYNLWKTVVDGKIYVKDNFSEPIIVTNIDNFTRTYSINDIIPYNRESDGSIQMNLYNNMFTQSNWDERERYNNVSVMTNINQAILGSLATAFIDDQSSTQYFNNSLSEERVVVFGHTHKPMIRSVTNTDNKECIYVNSGSWEDRKTRDKSAYIEQDTINMNFVIINPVDSDTDKLQIDLYQYFSGQHLLKDHQEIDL